MSRYRPIAFSLSLALKSAMLASLFAASLIASADTYYVTSVIGNRFETVLQGPESESSLIDKSKRGYNDFANDAFNKQAIRLMIDELLRADPTADVKVLTINDLSMLPVTDGYDDADSVKRFIQVLSKGLSIEPHAKLLVMAPWNSTILMRYHANEKQGKRVEGFGFYIDQEARKGLLAVFANVRMVMIDLNEGTLLATQSFRDSKVYSASHSPSQDIMDSASPEEKAHSFIALLQDSVREMIPPLINRKRGFVNVRLVE